VPLTAVFIVAAVVALLVAAVLAALVVYRRASHGTLADKFLQDEDSVL
jgi:hypothetical protein